MKVLKTVSVSFLLSMATASLANNAVLIQAPVDKVFVPTGFDNNDKVEVVVHGTFPNSCYKMGPTSARIDQSRKIISVSAQAYFYKGAVCAQIQVPFIKSVELVGSLQAGQYKVEVLNRPAAQTSPLTIARATRPDADDYLYAAVQTATLDEETNGQHIVLKGQHPYLLQGCVKFDGVKTSLNASKVLVVLPITHIENNSDACQGEVNNRFEYHLPLKSPLNKGEYLMHVRVLDGNSVNQLVNID